MLEVYFDGACEPHNPGPTASWGVIIFRKKFKNSKKEIIWQTSKLFDNLNGTKWASNNIAEYEGLNEALSYLLENNLQDEEILVRGDSNLVIEQQFGRWGIGKGLYTPYAIKARKLLTHFKNIRGEWIPREANAIADELSRVALLQIGIKSRNWKRKRGSPSRCPLCKMMKDAEISNSSSTNRKGYRYGSKSRGPHLPQEVNKTGETPVPGSQDLFHEKRVEFGFAVK